ncbi:acetamidase/formamidase family protein [Bradyrhizobium sp.]|jgi:acetamidase/formamidase|uniref:acetamidase/formamidase family protein n=1 Tax=Bradyrhizobium sp. TaxID=376 RepID=UPI002BE57A1A|nr:acetamidase/formamidase family protein [Bradyrhizobium sp.]HWX60492.1 acetamidase/formamidase family protein [Bradyrhizobium sp.]
MTAHSLTASSKTCHWGYFESTTLPVLTVKSGDRVTIDTVTGAAEHLPKEPGFHIPPAVLEIHKVHRPSPGPHILTGPIYVEGAQPGMVLEVRIIDITFFQDWGFQLIIPLLGTLPYDFDRFHYSLIPIDSKAMLGTLSWGLKVPLKPFFGVMGVAPPPGWGRATSTVPQAFGGNLDNKELVAGTTLYLPIFTEGALFSCGDGHGAQGDGEVCITAIETALTGTFEFIVRDDLSFTYPRAETPTHYITMGMDPSLDECAKIALRDMIRLIGEVRGLSAENAYMLCSLAANLRVTQTVNGSKGIHCMLEKALIDPPAGA